MPILAREDFTFMLQEVPGHMLWVITTMYNKYILEL